MVRKEPEASGTEFMALLERMDSKITVIAEGHGVLLQELRETRADLQRRVDEGFADIRLGIGSLVKRLDAHERAHA
jgi:hypothetical protein